MAGDTTMARPKRASRTITVRITEEAHRWAQIASGYAGEAIVDYISRVISKHGKNNALAGHNQIVKEEKPRRSKQE